MARREEETNEETPLLNRQTVEKSNAKFIYSYIFGFLLLLVSFVVSMRNTLPTPLSDVEATNAHDFPGIHCYNEYLSHFIEPHSANQINNEVIKDWIVSLAYDFKKEAPKGVQVDIVHNDPTMLVSKRNKFFTEEYWMVESRNVMIRITGKSNDTSESFMVNAHYDSVSTSNGVTDNGMGTAVAIELLRYFIHHPPNHSVIFLFNNFEEGGLIGADSFVNHPWFSTIKLYVNLEGTGAGGRALLFRSNTLAAVKGLAASSAHLFHASPLGNDLLQAKLLKSDTDYTVFSKYGVPGLDISFYYPRSHYHTQRDDLAHTTPQSLQHMGQMALGAVLAIDQSENMVHDAGKPEPIIYYDILGRVMLVYTFFTCQAINLVVLFVIPLALFTWSWFAKSSVTETSDVGEKIDAFKRNVWLMAQGLLATVAALATMVLFVFIASLLLLWINPNATYGSIRFVAVYIALASFLGLIVSQYALVKFSRSCKISLSNLNVGFYGLNCFWWLLLVFATYLGSQKIAAVYFAVYFFVSSTLATVLLVATTPVEGESSRFWSIAFLIQVLMPAILMIEFLLLSMDSMRHTTADGTPETAIYFLISVPIVLVVLHLLPWVHAAGNIRKTVTFVTALFFITFLICIITSPFNGDISPNRIVFNQEYNATEALSTVALITGSVLPKTLKQVLPDNEYETLNCEPYMTYQTRCTYQTALTPLYGRTPEDEITVFTLPRVCLASTCHLNITTKAEHSLLCQLSFSNHNITGLQAWVNGQSINAQGPIHALTTYSSRRASTVHWDLAYDADQEAGEALLTCFYDDWIRGELPAFSKLRDDLPNQNLLTIKGGVGLSKIHFSPTISLDKFID